MLALPPSVPWWSRRELRARALIGAVECRRGGVMAAQDVCRVHPFDEDDLDAVLPACDEVGIRCVLAPYVAGCPPLDSTALRRDTIPADEQWQLSGSAGLLFPPANDAPAAVEAFIRPRKPAEPLSPGLRVLPADGCSQVRPLPARTRLQSALFRHSATLLSADLGGMQDDEC